MDFNTKILFNNKLSRIIAMPLAFLIFTASYAVASSFLDKHSLLIFTMNITMPFLFIISIVTTFISFANA